MEEKTLTRKEKFLFPLIREVRDKGLPLGEISFDEFFKYLFVSIEYIFGYSKNEIRSNNSTRDISDIRKMFCLISFDEKPSVVEIIGKELNKPKGSDIWRFFRKAEDLMEFDNLYKKNYTLLKSFFLSLFEFEVDEKKLFEKAMALRNHGQFEKNNHQLIGYNYRLEGFQGAVLRVKLRKLDYWVGKRRKAAKLYNDLLAEIEVIAPPKEFLDISNFQYYVIRAKRRDDLKDYLTKNGVGAAIHYSTPLHLTEAYRFLGYKKGDFPVAEQHTKEILTLPLYPEITERQISYIVNLIKKFYRG